MIAARDAGDGLSPLVQLLEAVEVVRQQLPQRLRGVGDTSLGDLEDLRLGLVDGLRRVVGQRVAELDDLAGGTDEPTQQRPLLDDRRIAGGVRRCRRGVLQVDQRLQAADHVEQAGALQRLGHGDRVDRLTLGVQGADRVEDVLMRGQVEVGRVDGLDGRTDGVAAQQHRTQQRRLGLQIMRLRAQRRQGADESDA